MSTFIAVFKTQPDSAVALADPSQIDSSYRYWRRRVLATTLVGYALYYFVRTNISLALPVMGRDLHYSKAQLGVILTVGGVVYGVSKFLNGFLGDRANPRYFMALGLIACAAMNVAFGLSTSLLMLGTFWLLNNWAQGMGFPPCAKTMGHWFSPRERSTTFGIWHTGHMIGAALVSVLTGYLIKTYGDWRLCFYVPAALAAGGAFMILMGLRDTPGSMGLPPVEVYKGEETAADVDRETGRGESYRDVVVRNVFKNKFMWLISVANLLVYTLRYAALHWGPTFLQEMKHVTPLASGWLQFGSEMAGLVSALVAGFVADRWFAGRAGRVCALAMLAMTAVLYGFWVTPPSMKWLAGGLFVAMGFLVYIPQMLIAAMAMNLGTKRAAAAAVGLTGIFGYASSVISGWGVGRIVDRGGWGGAFELMIGCAVGTLVLMALTWNVGAHPNLKPGGADDSGEPSDTDGVGVTTLPPHRAPAK
jgi:OPA family glycerol-3-phosphate transporter-like MFS transporter/OPA family sugar phosphate sensor protein UhpC-like MFS transporter